MRTILCFRIWPAAMLLICLIVLCGRAEATPVAATLSPESAQVTEVSRLSVRMEGRGEGRAVLILPGPAKPESLKIFPAEDPELKISSLSWRALTDKGSAVNDAKRKQHRSLTAERNRLAAEIKGLEARIAFWQSQTKAKTRSLNDAVNLSAAISRNTKKAWQEKMTLEEEREKLDQRIATLQAEMKNPREAAKADWEVSLSLLGLKPESRSIFLRYSYTLSDCGWKPLYRLEANPGQERVSFSWEAEVWQNSPHDWAGVELSLATHPEGTPTVPDKAPEWRIGVEKTGARQASKKTEKTEAAGTPMRNPVAPFFRFLGTRSVPAGQKVVLPVESANWPAVFTRVLKPFSGRNAEMRAVITLPSPVTIPENPALFLRDGVLLGRREFGFSGWEKSLLFGSCPDVQAEINMLSEPGNAPAFDANKQVWDWRWQTVVKNEGGKLLKVRVEEPVPQIRDRRITFAMTGEPGYPEEKAEMGVRELELPPGAGRTLETFLHIAAPRDLNVEMSWTP